MLDIAGTSSETGSIGNSIQYLISQKTMRRDSLLPETCNSCLGVGVAGVQRPQQHTAASCARRCWPPAMQTPQQASACMSQTSSCRSFRAHVKMPLCLHLLCRCILQRMPTCSLLERKLPITRHAEACQHMSCHACRTCLAGTCIQGSLRGQTLPYLCSAQAAVLFLSAQR